MAMIKLLVIVLVIAIVMFFIVRIVSKRQEKIIDETTNTEAKAKMILLNLERLDWRIPMKYLLYSIELAVTIPMVNIFVQIFLDSNNLITTLSHANGFQIVFMCVLLLLLFFIMIALIYLCICTYDRLLCINIKFTNTFSIIILLMAINSMPSDGIFAFLKAPLEALF